MDPLLVTAHIINLVFCVNIYRLFEKNMTDREMKAPCNGQSPYQCCDKEFCESREIVKARLASEKTYLSMIAVPRFLGQVFGQNGVVRLLWEVTDAQPSGDFSFESLHLDFKSHCERASDTTFREYTHGLRAKSDVPFKYPIINEAHQFTFAQAKPSDCGNPGKDWTERFLMEILGGRSVGPLHASVTALNYLKFNGYQYGQNLVGGYATRDILSLVKLGILVNVWNVNVSNLDGELQKRPNERELTVELEKLYKKVSFRYNINGLCAKY